MSERVFLDANILVSAAWREEGGLLVLWRLAGIQLLTSGYAIVEADRNVMTAVRRTRLHRLVQRLEIVDEPLPRRLPAGIILPAKDVPILLAAIDSGAKYLLTGDKDHFRQVLTAKRSRVSPFFGPPPTWPRGRRESWRTCSAGTGDRAHSLKMTPRAGWPAEPAWPRRSGPAEAGHYVQK